MKKAALIGLLFIMMTGLVMTGCFPNGDDDDDTNPEPDTIVPSQGCGNNDFPQSGTYTMDVDGLQREYIVTLPDDYDPDEPYRLIFAWHYMGGTAAGIAGSGGSSSYYGLKGLSGDSAIFVAGQGLGTVTGWPNTGGRDVAFARAMYEELRNSYCIDENRVFSTGMSYGGIMSNTVGCEMGDVFRAIAPMSGMGPYGINQCTGQVAAWISHGDNDTVLPLSTGQASRDHWVDANSCLEQSSPVDPSPCVEYDGCDEGYPVIWCEFDGGHVIPSFAPDAIWDFFQQF